VFAGTDRKYGAAVSVTASHELLEMLGDPYINLAAEDTKRGLFVAYETADAVEADEFAYQRHGLPVSDFVTPVFFDPQHYGATGVRFSYRGTVAQPFALARGGYESVYEPGRGWTQRTARAYARVADRPRVGSRRERRRAQSEQGYLVPSPP
jgi:hypothetical protein